MPTMRTEKMTVERQHSAPCRLDPFSQNGETSLADSIEALHRLEATKGGVSQSKPSRANRIPRFAKPKAPEARTTVMIRNIPCRCTQEQLIEEISTVTTSFNFLYLPVSRKRDGTLGYAFVNFLRPEEAAYFVEVFQDHRFHRQPHSNKRATVTFALLQGFKENVLFYRRSKVAKGEFRPYVNRNLERSLRCE